MKLNKKLALAVASAVLSISSSAFAAVDFMNDDAPFKTDLNIAGHNGDLEFYGIIDIGGATINHSLPSNNALPNNIYPYSASQIPMGPAGNVVPNANVGSQQTWINGGLQDSRFGLKGGIDLFKADATNVRFIYQLETGFNPLNGELNNAAKTLAQQSIVGATSQKSNANLYTNTLADSSLNGELFARQAWGGIDAGAYGKLTGGIQYNPFYEIAANYDPAHKADTFSPLGESGAIGGGGGISENARMKNSFKYANTFNAPEMVGGKINAAVMYQFGNATGDTQLGRGYTAQVGYESPIVGFQVAYDNFTDAPKAGVGLGSAANSPAAQTQLATAFYNTQATMAALRVNPIKDLRLSAGYEWINLGSPSDGAGAGQLGQYATLFGYSNYSSQGLAGNVHQQIELLWAGGTYDFGQRISALDGLTLDVGYYDTLNGSWTGNDSTTAGTANKSSQVHTWTEVLDYKLNKRFDVYAAATQNHFQGAAITPSTVMATSVSAYGVGIRMKF